MQKLKNIIEFLLNLLDFLLHFKHKPDDTPVVVARYPTLLPPHPAARTELLSDPLR